MKSYGVCEEEVDVNRLSGNPERNFVPVSSYVNLCADAEVSSRTDRRRRRRRTSEDGKRVLLSQLATKNKKRLVGEI